jgi:SAM-dependent methyltransferase
VTPAAAENKTSAAAERNKEPIVQRLRLLLPEAATVLEIASGTGQHVAHFAAALPASRWQPTDSNPDNLPLIQARIAGLSTVHVAAPLLLDVHQADWGLQQQFDAVLAINLIHIAPWSATDALISGALRALRPEGARLLVLYGPFKREGVDTAPSNVEFDHSLQQRNPAWGLRDLGTVTQRAVAHGLRLHSVQEMPANNLLVVFAA